MPARLILTDVLQLVLPGPKRPWISAWDLTTNPLNLQLKMEISVFSNCVKAIPGRPGYPNLDLVALFEVFL